ncbi:MAG: flagellar export chaperone FliS [Leptothrix sp. (in: b-proteobacteria)]
MFSQASTQGRPRHAANLYHQVGVQTGISAATPHALTLMLYDGLLTAIKHARKAMGEGRIEDKGLHINHAGRIIDEGLKAALNLKAGGEIALNLRDLYDYCQVRLMQANLRNDDAALKEVLSLIEPVREGWAGIAVSMPS